MSVRKYNHSVLQWADGVDEGTTATIEAIEAPGEGLKLAIKRYKVNVLTADTVEVLDDATVRDTHYLGTNSGIVEDFGETPLILAENQAFGFGKTSGTTMSWMAQYVILEA